MRPVTFMPIPTAIRISPLFTFDMLLPFTDRLPPTSQRSNGGAHRPHRYPTWQRQRAGGVRCRALLGSQEALLPIKGAYGISGFCSFFGQKW